MVRILQENVGKPIFVSLLLVTALALLVSPTDAHAQKSADNWNRSVLPIPQPEFKGKMGLRTAESVLDFPAEITAPKGAPNILLIMPDDVGFGATVPFGGPVPTPALERIANAGLRYNQFHTTAPGFRVTTR